MGQRQKTERHIFRISVIYSDVETNRHFAAGIEYHLIAEHGCNSEAGRQHPSNQFGLHLWRLVLFLVCRSEDLEIEFGPGAVAS